MPDFDRRFKSVDVNMDTDEFLEKLEEERSYIQAAEEAVEEIVQIYQNEENKLERNWKIGKVAYDFHQEWGRSREECSNCGYKNLSTDQHCKMCNRRMEEAEQKKEYQKDGELKDRLKEAEGDTPKSLDEMKHFYRMFPDGDYDEDLATSTIETIGRAINYPDSVWKEVYKAIVSGRAQEEISDEEELEKHGYHHKKNKDRIFRQLVQARWKLRNGYAEPMGHEEDKSEKILAGTLTDEEIEELARDRALRE